MQTENTNINNVISKLLGIKKSFWIIGIVILLAIYLVGKYNTMISYKNESNLAWAQVENQMQRRFDLVPQLVASVQQVFKQEGEKNVYIELAKTRESYAGAKTIDEKIVASQNLNSGLARLLAITENYPVLKASENIKELQASIEGTENRMSVERGRFNESVGRYNGYILVIPNNIIAKVFGFTSMKTFDSDEASTKAPNVKDLFNN